jgi:hypothetical protein
VIDPAIKDMTDSRSNTRMAAHPFHLPPFGARFMDSSRVQAKEAIREATSMQRALSCINSTFGLPSLSNASQ